MLPAISKAEYAKFAHLFPSRDEHPLKKVFFRRVRWSALADLCICDEATISKYLNGHLNMPEDVERKLYDLAERMEMAAHDAA